MDVPQSKDIKKGKIPSQTVSIIKKCSRDKKKKKEQSNKKFDRLVKFLRHLVKFLC